jgi:hypothetical protein
MQNIILGTEYYNLINKKEYNLIFTELAYFMAYGLYYDFRCQHLIFELHYLCFKCKMIILS